MTSQPFSLRSEADVLALVPHTLGFHPEDSLVLITLGPRSRPFHARIDLPDGLDDLRLVVEQLVFAAVRNDGDRAMVVAYTDDECLAEAAVVMLTTALEAAGIEPLMELRADGRRWYPLGLDHLDLRSIEGVPYDVSSHELTTQSVLAGKVTFRNREELVDSLTPVDPEAVEAVSLARATLGDLGPDDSALLQESRWLLAQLPSAQRAQLPVVVPAATAARVLRAIHEQDVRDLAWCEISRANAEVHVTYWRELVRRSPEQLVAPAAGLLAFSAWLAGDGALAWCAVDRALRADPDHTLGQLVGRALELAVPPTTWEPPDPSSLRLRTA